MRSEDSNFTPLCFWRQTIVLRRLHDPDSAVRAACVEAVSSIAAQIKVLVAALCNSFLRKNPRNVIASMSGTETSDEEGRSKAKVEIQNATEDHGFLNKAAIEKPEFPSLYCTVKEVEEVKIVLRILPIFMYTIMLNCCLAQLSTFSVQQAATMNTKIGSLRIPPASLPVFPVLFVMVLALVYNHIIIPFARKITKSEMGITHLQRIGTGLVLSIVAMAIAALVESTRVETKSLSTVLLAEPPTLTMLPIRESSDGFALKQSFFTSL